VVEFARAFPGLPVVVLGVELGTDRAVPAALDAAPNVVCAVADIRTPEGLARLCETFGSGRFVYGSGEGATSTSALASIREAKALTDEARAAVLHGNADALAHGRYADEVLS
jgi:predicted TIM-barrel fold metal-dependent hydrolase